MAYNPYDLTLHPPRSPRCRLGGLVILPRMLDKARATLEGHQRAIMGAMTVDEIFKDRKKFSEQVFDVASTDLVNMGIQVYHC